VDNGDDNGIRPPQQSLVNGVDTTNNDDDDDVVGVVEEEEGLAAAAAGSGPRFLVAVSQKRRSYVDLVRCLTASFGNADERWNIGGGAIPTTLHNSDSDNHTNNVNANNSNNGTRTTTTNDGNQSQYQSTIMGDELSSILHLLHELDNEGYDSPALLRRICARGWGGEGVANDGIVGVDGGVGMGVAARRLRSSSVFSHLDQDDDDDDDSTTDDSDNDHNHNLPPPKATTTTTTTTLAPLTFGRPGHFALGRISHNKSRPRRVEGELRDVDVVAVSCGTHHTVFVDGGGVVWTCGLGKGGRLGTGDTQNRPIPTPLLSLHSHPHQNTQRRVRSVSCSDNHTLACTDDGGVYAWGSDRFGQLGSGSDGSRGSMVPRVVEGKVLRGRRVVGVAAGTRHSVVVDWEGIVYSWGDNRYGQCGRRAHTSPLLPIGHVDGFAPKTTNPHNNNNTNNNNFESYKRAVSLAAGDRATLCLVLPIAPTRPNGVYSWGFGTCQPSRVQFPSPTPSHDEDRGINSTTNKQTVYPNRIAAAKFHFVAGDEEGRVYTWGLKADPLGQDMSSNNKVLRPQLVGALDPHRHGKIVALSAAEGHTAVVTDTGDLYTWGATTTTTTMTKAVSGGGGDRGGALGHGSAVRYQPIPKRVEGVARAIAVAAARDHSVDLVGGRGVSTDPDPSELNGSSGVVGSLQSLCEDAVIRGTTVFNVVSVLLYADAMGAWRLVQAARRFVRLNLDSVLAYTDWVELDLLLGLEEGGGGRTTAIGSGCVVGEGGVGFRDDCVPVGEGEVKRIDTATGCAESVKKLSVAEHLSTRLDFTNVKTLSNDWTVSTKELRSVKKKLAQIAELEPLVERLQQSQDEQKKVLTKEQEEKIGRKKNLQRDVRLLTNILDRIKRSMRAFKITVPQKDCVTIPEKNGVSISDKNNRGQTAPAKEELFKGFKIDADVDISSTAESAVSLTRKPVLHCKICNIKCPDINSYTLHVTGRKHHNRVKQLEQQKQQETLAQIMDTKRRKDIEKQLSASRVSPVSRCSTEGQNNESKHVAAGRVSGPKMSFQQILQEEENRRARCTAPQRPKPQKQLATKVSNTSLGFTSAATMSYSAHSEASAGGGGRVAVSLIDFLSPQKKPRKKSISVQAISPSVVAWKKPTIAFQSAITSERITIEGVCYASTAKQSLAEIQREEESKVAPLLMNSDSKWYMSRQERALSIGEIQKKEKEELEMASLVTEQFEIEAQIKADTEEAIRKSVGSSGGRKGRRRKGGDFEAGLREGGGRKGRNYRSEGLHGDGRGCGSRGSNSKKSGRDKRNNNIREKDQINSTEEKLCSVESTDNK